MNKPKKTYNREGYGKDKKQYHGKKPLNQEKAFKGKSSFYKNPNGFLVVSLFVNAQSTQNDIIDSIESALAINHKKKIVISFENDTNTQLISSIKKKFQKTFGIFFLNPKAKMGGSSTINSSKVHTEVLHSFKSHFFLTLDSSVTIREFSIEKMISFLSKDGDTLAVSPKFYDKSSGIIKSCRRFFSIWNFMPENCANFIKEKNVEHFMMERGDIGYYSIHRVDFSTLDCMLFLTDQLIKIKSFPLGFNTQDLRDAYLCKKFYKKINGKIIFYPHARVISNKDTSKNNPTLIEKIKYFV